MDSSTINICSCSEPVAILRNKIITTKLATGILTTPIQYRGDISPDFLY